MKTIVGYLIVILSLELCALIFGGCIVNAEETGLSISRESLSMQHSFEDRKRFLGFYAKRYWKMMENEPPERHPLSVLERLEKTKPAQARKAMEEMINECLETSRHLSVADVMQLDSELKSLGILTLTELRRENESQYRKIVARGLIKSENEYSLIQEVAVDQANGVSPKERALLDKMMEVYETKIVSKR